MVINSKSKKINVFICLGTRPEGIKLAPIIKLLEKDKSRFSFIVCSTGQHREMLKKILDFFEIKPDYDLDLMTENQSLSSLSSKVLNRMDDVLNNSKPDIVLVQGDTTTAFLTALSSFYKKIKVGHVEAGLRTYNKYSPFPEEINRQLISKVADLHFAPTEKSVNNLINEGIGKAAAINTGNTVIDAINWSIKKIEASKDKIETLEPFKSLDKDKKIILVTMHRRESFGLEIENICYALKDIAKKYKEIQIVYPVHLNTNVRGPVFEILKEIENIKLIDPMDYESFIWLMKKSYLIVTDSGGIQEEAPTLNKPVLVIRKYTERTESVDIGISKLVGTDRNNIIQNISILVENEEEYKKMISNTNPYGDGHAADRILDTIEKHFNDLDQDFYGSC